MHLLYADDSGSVGDASQRYFVLAGISVFERQIYYISKELDEIAARFNPSEPLSIELHGSPMLNGRGIWRRFPLPERIQAIKDALGALARTRGPRVFGAVILKTRAAYDGKDPIEYAFEQLANRFDLYLMRLHRHGDPQRGVMVLDKSKNESAIQALASRFREIGHTWGKLYNFAEVPLFLDSRASRLVQLADLVAYSMFRHFEGGDPQFYNLVEPWLDAEGGAIHGLCHFV